MRILSPGALCTRRKDFPVTKEEAIGLGKGDLSGMDADITDEMKRLANYISNKRGSLARGSPEWEKLCCMAMAWAEQTTIEACAKHTCGPFPNVGTGIPPGAMITTAYQLTAKGHSIPKNVTMFLELWNNAGSMASWKKRVDFGMGLC